MTEYINMYVTISECQKDKIRKAAANDTEVSIRFTHEHLEGNDILAFTKSQMDEIAEAYVNNKGITIEMSKTQVKHNRSVSGGFIGSLLAGVASAVAPSVIGWIWNKISGKKEVYAKNGGGILKIPKMGEGLYLRPYKSDVITGSGLWMKIGNEFEQIHDASDTGIINNLIN